VRIDPNALLDFLKGEFRLVSGAVRDKGAKRFGRALALAGVMILMAYAGLYAPPQKKLAYLDREIAAARAMHESGTQYAEMSASLLRVYSSLPQIKDREQWLGNATIDSLRAEGITPESLSTPIDNEVKNIIVQRQAVALTARFPEFYSWLLRVESAKPLMHIQSVEVGKKDEPLGYNAVSCDVTTVIPKRRLN
jgi:hypothetical protein